jgi:hypothetical protein
MWQSRLLTILWAFTTCHRDRFTFPPPGQFSYKEEFQASSVRFSGSVFSRQTLRGRTQRRSKVGGKYKEEEGEDVVRTEKRKV